MSPTLERAITSTGCSSIPSSVPGRNLDWELTLRPSGRASRDSPKRSMAATSTPISQTSISSGRGAAALRRAQQYPLSSDNGWTEARSRRRSWSSGVEILKVELGVDSDDDLQVDKYLPPSAVTDWADVMLARLALVCAWHGPRAGGGHDNLHSAARREQSSYTPPTSVNHFARMLFEVSIHLRNTVGIRTPR